MVSWFHGTVTEWFMFPWFHGFHGSMVLGLNGTYVDGPMVAWFMVTLFHSFIVPWVMLSFSMVSRLHGFKAWLLHVSLFLLFQCSLVSWFHGSIVPLFHLSMILRFHGVLLQGSLFHNRTAVPEHVRQLSLKWFPSVSFPDSMLSLVSKRFCSSPRLSDWWKLHVRVAHVRPDHGFCSYWSSGSLVLVLVSMMKSSVFSLHWTSFPFGLCVWVRNDGTYIQPQKGAKRLIFYSSAAIPRLPDSCPVLWSLFG